MQPVMNSPLLSAATSCRHQAGRPFAATPAVAALPAQRQRRRGLPAHAQLANDAARAVPPAVFTDAASLASRDLRGTVAIAGAGPAGLAAAAALHRAGLPVMVLEAAEQLPAGGSALGLWTNAWRALDALGAAEPLRRQHPTVQE